MLALEHMLHVIRTCMSSVYMSHACMGDWDPSALSAGRIWLDGRLNQDEYDG